jgi:hypothetical protein
MVGIVEETPRQLAPSVGNTTTGFSDPGEIRREHRQRYWKIEIFEFISKRRLRRSLHKQTENYCQHRMYNAGCTIDQVATHVRLGLAAGVCAYVCSKTPEKKKRILSKFQNSMSLFLCGI